MKVLVTGGSGKAGSFVVQELAQAGHSVTNVDRMRPSEPQPGGFLLCDLTDAGQVYDCFFQVRPDAVCHVAANPAPGGDPRNGVFSNNVLSAYHVFQAAGDLGTVTRFAYASSEMATGWLTADYLPERFPIREEDRVDTPNAYALSKYLGEVIADSMILRYPQMAIVSLRINNVITPVTYHWLKQRRDKYPEGGSNNYWSYIDARDVASAFRLSVEGSTIGHEVFLIAASDTSSDRPIQQALTDRFGPEAAEKLPPDHGPFQSVFDCSKIERLLGWKARYTWRNL